MSVISLIHSYKCLTILKRKGAHLQWEADMYEDIKVFFNMWVEIIRKKLNNSSTASKALDNMKRTGLTYNGWQADVHEAQDFHVRYPRRYVR